VYTKLYTLGTSIREGTIAIIKNPKDVVYEKK